MRNINWKAQYVNGMTHFDLKIGKNACSAIRYSTCNQTKCTLGKNGNTGETKHKLCQRGCKWAMQQMKHWVITYDTSMYRSMMFGLLHYFYMDPPQQTGRLLHTTPITRIWLPIDPHWWYPTLKIQSCWLGKVSYCWKEETKPGLMISLRINVIILVPLLISAPPFQTSS